MTEPSIFVADAHTLVWHVADDKRLGAEAKTWLVAADDEKPTSSSPPLFWPRCSFWPRKGD